MTGRLTFCPAAYAGFTVIAGSGGYSGSGYAVGGAGGYEGGTGGSASSGSAGSTNGGSINIRDSEY